MEQFAYPTFDTYESRFALVHQVIGVDLPLDRRYRVPGSPTFVLVDHVGTSAGRLDAVVRITRAALSAG